jgi:hypothetical protein
MENIEVKNNHMKSNVIITSIGKIEEFKISSMPSNVICCDYHEVEFNV